MREDPLGAILRQFRRVEGMRFAGALSDAELLDRFLAHRDEAAFEVLVWRHGPMVLRVCHRILGQAQDAEDAFQATFLVLFRKAESIDRRASLAAWLHRVACRVAWRLRKKNAPLVTRRQPLTDVPAPEPPVHEDGIALWLDEAINRLPERYRAAFILCCLQERTYEQAAAELGCPLGTVQSRLARARQRLQTWLKGRGLTVGGALGFGLTETSDAAEMAAPLVRQTMDLAAQLAAGTLATPPTAAIIASEVIRSLLVARTRVALLAVLAVATLLGGWAWQTSRAEPPDSQPRPPARIVERPPEVPQAKHPALDLPELQGAWGLDLVDGKGERPRPGERKSVLMILKEKHCILKLTDTLEIQATLAGDPGANPPSFWLTIEAVRGDPKSAARAGRFGELLAACAVGDTLAGIYRRSGKTALLALTVTPGRPPPAAFPPGPEPDVLLLRGFLAHRVLLKTY